MLGTRVGFKYPGINVLEFIAATTGYTGDGGNSNLVLPYPSGWAAGDEIFALVVDQYGTFPAFTYPAGWTAVRTDKDTSGAAMFISSRVLTADDVPSISITPNVDGGGSDVPMIGAMLLYRNPQSPLVNTSAFAKDTTHTVDDQSNAPSATPSRDGRFFSVFMKRTTLPNVATPPSGMTLRAFRNDTVQFSSPTHPAILTGGTASSPGFTVAVYDAAATSGVATGVKTLTWDHSGAFYENDNRYGQTVVI